MIGDRHRQILSAFHDGELSDGDRAEAERLVAESAEAREYLERLESLRARVGEEAVPPPDLAPRILAALRRGPRTSPRRLAAAFAAGIVAGAVFIGFALREPSPVAAADLPDEVLAAQNRVDSLTAELSIVERGWHPDVPERVYSGTLVYSAPETLWISIDDLTTYPSPEWIPNRVESVTDRERAWSAEVPGCPTSAQPGCTPSRPRLAAVEGREPFPDRDPAPLDLIVPVAGFTRSGPPRLLGEATLDGVPAVGVEVTAAQVASLIEGLTTVGNWRAVHPTDRVELWLDREALIPLSLLVYPADSSDRELWAIRNGYTGDDPAVAILEVRWTEVSINGEVAAELLSAPQGARPVSAGFVDAPVGALDVMTPSTLPRGMTLYRTGRIATVKGPLVTVVAWSDGRAWLKVSWTREWAGDRLFGDLGELVRRVEVGEGVAYLDERGEKVALHGDGLDVVVTGSLPTATMLEVAAGLDVVGTEVPETWEEATSGTLEEAVAAIDGLLVPPELSGFGPPAIRLGPESMVFAYAGPGSRGFLLAETTDRLSPPLEADVRGVTVRGLHGRYSPGRGLLEWEENRLTIGLSSQTLSLDELIAIAEALEGR